MTTRLRLPKFHRSAASKRGFTLVEMLVVVVLSSLVLAGVMAIFLFLTKSQIRSQHYRDMDTEARRALEYLARDMRMASDIQWTGTAATTTKVRLTVPTGWDSSTNSVVNSWVYYRLVPVPSSNASLRRKLGTQFLGRVVTTVGATDPDSDSTADEDQYEPLQGYIATGGLEFRRFERGDSYIEASNDWETKQVKLEMKAERSSMLVSQATQYVISARFVLRNKVVAL